MYQYNEHGVCTNPDIFMQVETKEHYAKLKICQLPNGAWTFGYSFGVHFGNMAGCSGPASITGHQYPTPAEAKKAAINYYQPKIQTMIQDAKEWNRRQRIDNTSPVESMQTTLF